MDKKGGITDFLLGIGRKKTISFHMPGHKGGEMYKRLGYGEYLERIMDLDITEIEGADNLHQPESVIVETMDKYRALYESQNSYLLINGSSCGLVAGIMSICKRGEEIIVARNSHKSIYNGVRLAGAKPIYAYPEIIEEYGVSGEITPEEVKRCFEEAPNAKGMVLPSPNYYGICSDISSISDFLHSIGKVLIVDQAHGAHLKFFDRYVSGGKSAENGGADLIINSTHKTLASLTQTAVANLCTDRISRCEYEDKLQMMESTSPSYIMMASLDINADIMEENGEELIELWNTNVEFFLKQAEKIQGLKVMKHPRLDKTKLNLDMSAVGLSGRQLEKELMERGIFVELVTGNILMALTGIGNSKEDYMELLEALRDISSKYDKAPESEKKSAAIPPLSVRAEQREIPSEKELVELEASKGRICGAAIVPYPPGIPLVCPGEVIDEEVVNYVKVLREEGLKVIGIDEKGMVSVGR